MHVIQEKIILGLSSLDVIVSSISNLHNILRITKSNPSYKNLQNSVKSILG